jgi:hypothetical protein
MRNDEDIETYLLETGVSFEPLGDGLWVLHDEENGVDNIVLHHDSPYLTVRVKVMPIPTERREELFEKLLRLNRSDMVHGAYGIEEDAVVITDTIQSPNLDLNEIQASIEAAILAVSEHYDMLSEFRP